MERSGGCPLPAAVRAEQCGRCCAAKAIPPCAAAYLEAGGAARRAASAELERRTRARRYLPRAA